MLLDKKHVDTSRSIGRKPTEKNKNKKAYRLPWAFKLYAQLCATCLNGIHICIKKHPDLHTLCTFCSLTHTYSEHT